MTNIWLHLGMGSFHRAHQAYAFNRLIEEGNTNWRFISGNIRDDAEATVTGMLKQDLHYTLETVNPEGERKIHDIHSISRVIPYVKGLKPLIDQGADPDCKVISFTVTEAGYYLDSKLNLNCDHPVIAASLKGEINNVYATCAAILQQRMANGAGDITLLSCDNVRENGRKFEHGLRLFLQHRGLDSVLAFLNEHVTCPNTMVDRITPRPAADLNAEIEKLTGHPDCVPVMAEEFFQWVIEDNFKAGRPALEKCGAQMVNDVTPFEDAKLRILNASHSILALSGIIKGYNYVFECARDPELYQLAYSYVTDSVIPCIKGNGIDLENYRDEVLRRFKNNHIRDTLQRICQDCYSKLISFVKPTISDCFHKGVNPQPVLFITALYLHFLHLWQAGQIPFEYQDSSFDPNWARQILQAPDEVAAYAAGRELFGDLACTPQFVSAMHDAVHSVKLFAKAHHAAA